MERLTKRINDVVTYIGTENEYDTGMIAAETASSVAAVREILLRLAAYEDTGREPEEVTALGKLFDYALEESKTLTEQLTLLNHIRELAEADKDGRVVVLPCKVGAYMIDQIFPERPRLMKNVRPSIVYVSKGAIYNMALETFESAVAEGIIIPASEESERAMEGRKNG